MRMLIWFFLAGVLALWLIFGSIQDMRVREIANWVTLSLIGIGLAARLFVSLESGNWDFFLIGVTMTFLFTAISFALYYSKVFAGGDAKLLMGLGAFIPGTNYSQTVFNGVSAVLALLIIGAIYSFVYSIRIAWKHPSQFRKELAKRKKWYHFIVPFVALMIVALVIVSDPVLNLLGGLIAFSLILYPYLMAVDKCMVRLYSPHELAVGDWIQEDVVVGGKRINATVHGLSEKEIALLIKARKKVLVKEGIPFVPVFLITYLLMVFFFVSGWNWLAALS